MYCNQMGGRRVKCETAKRRKNGVTIISHNVFIPVNVNKTIRKRRGYDTKELLAAAWLTINAMKERNYPCNKINEFLQRVMDMSYYANPENGYTLEFLSPEYEDFIKSYLEEALNTFPGIENGDFDPLIEYANSEFCDKNTIFNYNDNRDIEIENYVNGRRIASDFSPPEHNFNPVYYNQRPPFEEVNIPITNLPEQVKVEIIDNVDNVNNVNNVDNANNINGIIVEGGTSDANERVNEVEELLNTFLESSDSSDSED